MPKDSCIDHPKSYYLELRRDYLDLFDGDHCAAALMGYFEYATNGELARFKRAGETGDPWVRASVPELIEDTLGLYKTSSVQARLDRLERWGLLTIQQVRIGSPRNYLLDVKLTNDLLKNRRVLIVENNDEEEVYIVENNYVSNDVANDVAPVLNLKEESLITDHKEENTLPSFEDCGPTELQPHQIVNLIAVAYKARTRSKLTHAQKEAWHAWLDQNTVSTYEFIAEVEKYFEDPRYKSVKWATGSFRKSPQNSQHYMRQTRNAASFAPLNIPGVKLGSAIALPDCDTIPDFLVQCKNGSFTEIVTLYITHGQTHRTTLTVIENFWKVFRTHTPEQQAGGADNARVLFPQGYLRNLLDWWATKPWTAPNKAPVAAAPPSGKVDKTQKAYDMLMAEYAERERSAARV